MENQMNIGIQRQLYEPHEDLNSEAEDSGSGTSLADDSSAANTRGNTTLTAPHIDGESAEQLPTDTIGTNHGLHRYGISDGVVVQRPEYAAPDYSPHRNVDAQSNALSSESRIAQHEATAWMKEASISGSNDSGGSIDSGTDSGGEDDYGGGDVGGGGDYGGGIGDGGSGPTGGGEDSGSSAGSGDHFDTVAGNGNDGTGTTNADCSDSEVSVGGRQSCDAATNAILGEDGNPLLTANGSQTLQTITVSTPGEAGSQSTTTSSDVGDTGSTGGSLNDYLRVDSYSVGSQTTNESTSADATNRDGSRTNESLPPVENLYQPFEGHAATSYRDAVAVMANPNANWDERIINGTLATLATPIAVIDMMGEALMNSPNAAGRAGQFFAQANVTNNPDTRVTSTLTGIVEMTNAFNGAVGPFAGAVGVPQRVMTVQELSLQRFQGAEATAAARATYAARFASLDAHEQAGGHLLARHVGQSEAALRARLASEPRISASSSFYNRAAADSAVSQALSANQAIISDWLAGSSSRLTLNFSARDPMGIFLSRGQAQAGDVNSVTLILVRDPSMPDGYRILTGFPTKP